MKKSIILFAVALGMLTSCDPIKDTDEMAVNSYTSSNLLDGAEFSQYEDQACTSPKEDGNWIKYNIPNVTSAYIFYKKADGSEFKLASGSAGGVFNFVPARGSDPHQTVYFRFINANGEEVVASKDFTVQVASELPMGVRFLASNDYGKKIWTWDSSIADGGEVWGNMGYLPGNGASVGTSGNGKWWGIVTSDDFNGQLQHTPNNANEGDGSLDAYMVFSEDGIVTSYDAQGNVIRSGSFAIENYSPDAEWKVADLKTDAILWPWIINTGGKTPADCGWGSGAYEVVYLTSDKMTLVYPGYDKDKGQVNGSWGEATFWHFKSSSDLSGMLAGYDNGKDWTWDSSVADGGEVWGNMGYQPGDGASVGISGNGKWWGIVTSDDFNGQLQHTPGNANEGDGNLEAYMTFGTDGTVTSYTADGSVIRSGAYELTKVEGDSWKVGELKTDAILWPWIINTGGKLPSDCGWGPGAYEVVYLTGNQMTLVYPGFDKEKGQVNGSWGEATFWHFKAK